MNLVLPLIRLGAIATLLSGASATLASDVDRPASPITSFESSSGRLAATDSSSWPGDSLYHLDHTWTDQDGTKKKLSSFASKHVVIAFVFTHCRMSCPITVAHLKALEVKSKAAGKEDVQFALISLDPERDTPPVLKAFAKKNGLDAKRWTLFNGTAEDVRELSVALQMRFKKTGKGDFSHGRAISILGPKGTIVYQGQSIAEELVVIPARP